MLPFLLPYGAVFQYSKLINPCFPASSDWYQPVDHHIFPPTSAGLIGVELVKQEVLVNELALDILNTEMAILAITGHVFESLNVVLPSRSYIVYFDAQGPDSRRTKWPETQVCCRRKKRKRRMRILMRSRKLRKRRGVKKRKDG